MENTIKRIFETSHSKSEVARVLKFPINGNALRKVDKLIKLHNINIDHFDSQWKNKKKRIYERIIKICPICQKEFQTLKGQKKEKTTCSRSCSNTYYRTGDDNPNSKLGKGKSANASYRYICFKFHKKECVVCGENVILDVHHYDGDHKNNEPENLVPLCPTHHQYWHSRFRYLIKEKIDNYVNWFINKMVIVV